MLSLKPSTKLIAQIALASALLFFDYRLNWLESITLDSLLTLFWVVGLTNAFNLIDNMDGLCAGIAMIVGAALLVDLLPGAAGTRAFFEVRYLAILLGATGGFLVYNLHPASIFMGDSGSLLLGFSFAAVTLSAGHRAPAARTCCRSSPAPVLRAADSDLRHDARDACRAGCRAGARRRAGAIIRRTGSWPSVCRSAARSRCSGCSRAIGGVLGVGVGNFGQTVDGARSSASAFLIGMVLFAAYLAGIRVYDDADARVKQGTFTPIVVEFMHKRRVAEVLLDFCLVAMCYYAAYRLRFEDPDDFMRELRDVHAVAAGDRAPRRWSRSSRSASIAACGGTSG